MFLPITGLMDQVNAVNFSSIPADSNSGVEYAVSALYTNSIAPNIADALSRDKILTFSGFDADISFEGLWRIFFGTCKNILRIS